MKTLEEYFLKQLDDTKNELELVKKENEELKEKLENRKLDELPEKDLPKSKTITISEQPNYYFVIHCENYYYWNEYLKKANKTPEWLLTVKNDEQAYEEFCNIPVSWGMKMASVKREVYDILLVNFYKKKSVLFTEKNGLYRNFIYNIDNEEYFLDEELAKNKLKKEIFDKIDSYFNGKYNEKFAPKEENDSQ